MITNHSVTNQILFGKKHGEKVSWKEVISNEFVDYFAINFRAKAKAAIEAMREPTDEMLLVEGVHESCHMCGGHLEGYRAMIVGALK